MDNRKRVVIVGGGAAGLVAAYTLKKRGINVILFEENDRAGGRLRGDRVDGFYIDEGADFFCSSYDVVFRMCEELNLPLVRSVMKLGWYRNGKWIISSPIDSLGLAISRLTALWNLGFITPRSIRPMLRIARSIRKEAVCMGLPHMFEEIDKVRHQLNKEVTNLFLAGDYMRVPSVNGAMASGIGAAKQAAECLASKNE